MGRKRIGILLVTSMIVTGVPWASVSYAAERDDILSETYDTVIVEDQTPAEDNTVREGVVSETVMTTPVTEEESGDAQRPDGVTSMTLKTTAESKEDENGDEGSEGTETMDVTGRSSMPDPSELGLYAEDIVNMVMPVVTDETYDFVMDSGDLLSRFSDNRDDYEKASLYFYNTTGEKSHTNTSDVAMAKNKSSVPVLLYVTFQVENEYGWDVNFTDMDSVEADEGKNISFAIIPVSSNNIKEENEDSEETGEPDDGYRFFKDKMINIDENGKAEMILYLPGTPDNFDVVEGMYMAKDDAVWSSMGFAVTGACNTKADWSEFNDRVAQGESIGIHISYRMDTLTEEQKAWIEEGHGPDEETGVVMFDISE